MPPSPGWSPPRPSSCRFRPDRADVPNPLDDPLAAQRAQREAGEIAAEHQTGQGRPIVLDRYAQGDEGAKKPLASWMRLVAMISVPICVHIDPAFPSPLRLECRPLDSHNLASIGPRPLNSSPAPDERDVTKAVARRSRV
jgi:hypothetical protein